MLSWDSCCDVCTMCLPPWEGELQSGHLNLNVHVGCSVAACGSHRSPLKPSLSLEEQRSMGAQLKQQKCHVICQWQLVFCPPQWGSIQHREPLKMELGLTKGGIRSVQRTQGFLLPFVIQNNWINCSLQALSSWGFKRNSPAARLLSTLVLFTFLALRVGSFGCLWWNTAQCFWSSGLWSDWLMFDLVQCYPLAFPLAGLALPWARDHGMASMLHLPLPSGPMFGAETWWLERRVTHVLTSHSVGFWVCFFFVLFLFLLFFGMKYVFRVCCTSVSVDRIFIIFVCFSSFPRRRGLFIWYSRHPVTFSSVSELGKNLTELRNICCYLLKS